jgi:glycosyltransferase involved in cell wall biosynthesis
MDNKKIILITNEYPPKRGGAGVYCEELIHSSKELGISIEGWVPKYVKFEKNSNFISLPIKGSQDWVCSWRLIKHFKKEQAKMPKNTVLHLAEPGSLRAFIRFGWIFKELPKLLITIHGSELIRFCKNPVESFLFKKLLEQTKTVHVLSKFNQEQVERFCPVIKERILLLPGAAARKVKGDLGKKEKAVKTMIKVLCVGRIHPRKGQDLLIDAVCALPTDLKKKLECVFVGPIVKKKFFRGLQEKVASTNCKVTFPGRIGGRRIKNGLRICRYLCTRFYAKG